MENLKIKLQILDENGKVLISSTIDAESVKTIKELHGVSILDDIYNSLLENLEKIDK